MKKLLMVAAIIVATFYAPNIARADTPITIESATAFTEIYDTGTNVNYIFAVRYNLPQPIWYTHLEDITGCTTTTGTSTIKCTYPDTLNSTLLTIGLYDNAGTTYGSSYTEPLTVIGDTLTGLNVDELPNGKTLQEMSDDGSKVCIDSLSTHVGIHCVDIVISTEAIVDVNDTYRARMTKFLQDQIIDIELDTNLPEETLITNTGKVTGNGVYITRRVSPLLQQSIPELFAVGLLDIFGTPVPFATPELAGTLLSNASTGTYTSSIYEAGNVMSKQYFGMSGYLFWAFLFIMMSLISGSGMYLISGSNTMGATIGFVTPLVAAVFLAPQILTQVAAGLFVLMIGLVIFIARKMPN